jgi:ABC-2 type transport system permease protein
LSSPERYAHLTKTQRTIAGTCFGLAAIPLFPQGIVATAFVATGKTNMSWFLATYMPSGLRYPVSIGFIGLGLAMYATALYLIRRPRQNM